MNAQKSMPHDVPTVGHQLPGLRARGTGEPPDWAVVSDDVLRRELAHAHEMRHDTFLSGSTHALVNHSTRTAALEAEFLRRLPHHVVDAHEKEDLYRA